MKVFKQRDWNETKSNDAWSIFKIMGEFVMGFEALQRIGPCISIYGSARMKEGSPVYEAAREVAFDAVMAVSGSVFGATADALLDAAPHAAGHPVLDEPDDEPLFVEVAAPTIRVRARVRSVDRSTAYEGTAFERGDDDDA